MKRILMAVLIMMSLTIGTFAQRGQRQGPPPAGATPGGRGGGFGGPGGQRGDPATALKNALNLTEAQVVSIQALMKTRQERSQPLMEDIRAKQEALDALMKAASPDPTAIGNATLALQNAQKKLEGEREWFIAELKKLLTIDQQDTLDKLIAVGTPIPGLGGPGGPRGGMRGPRPGGGI